MKYSDIKELYYICHIDNLASIFKEGILCHTKARELKYKDVSMREVQVKREIKTVPGGMNLHNYANLYFDARNPMLRKRLDADEILCVLAVNKQVMKQQGAIVTDGNAASGYTRFYPSPEGADFLDADLIFAKYWKDSKDDKITQFVKKRMKCAEVLIPYKIAQGNIMRVYVSNEQTKGKIVNEKIPGDVIINKYLFFQEGEA
ncbi:MAG TPA: DUF4433 domain-containing protein [bacterium]|nr:DUF4433 domain-containing protein [bacterium]